MFSGEFDYIVYGASGFTGQFVLEDVARSLKDSKRTYAIAGRNEQKLKKTLQESGKIIGRHVFLLMYSLISFSLSVKAVY